MRNEQLLFAAVALVLLSTSPLLSQCRPTYSSTTTTGCFSNCTIEGLYAPDSCPLCKGVTYTVAYPDGYEDYLDSLDGTGQYNKWYAKCETDASRPYDPQLKECWPEYLTPDVSDAYFYAERWNKVCIVSVRAFCGLAYYNQLAVCGFPNIFYESVRSDHECIQSPVIVDLSGDGIRLTSAENGVYFDIDARGTGERIAWTPRNSDDAWLALDRNHNGRIDNGSELFGNNTDQPESDEPNGFVALAVFDQSSNGGNGDGKIDNGDLVFDSLLLWRDRNKDGRTQRRELLSLSEAGLVSIDLRYHRARRVDQYGNIFRFRSRVTDIRGSRIGKWAWDVFLKVAKSQPSTRSSDQCP